MELNWILLMMASGIILLLVEIFLVPGLSIAGIAGFLLMMVAVYFLGRTYGAFVSILSFIASLSVVVGAFFLFYRSPAAKWMVLDRQIEAKSDEIIDLQIQAQGTTTTPLFPTGKASFEINGQAKIYDVSSQGEFVPAQGLVEVIKIEGNRIYVRAV